MRNIEPKPCKVCGENFSPNKYSPRQSVCTKLECQRVRQIESMRDWRTKHPNYFKYDESKGEEWLKAQRERSKTWRQNNPEKIRDYRKNHLEDYRTYMRDYMRKYRENKKSSDVSAPPVPLPPPPASSEENPSA